MKSEESRKKNFEQGMYDPIFEHDNCGVGFVADINGEKNHDIIQKGMGILRNLIHRGAVGGDDATGDGAGILFQIPFKFLNKVCGEEGLTLPDNGDFGVAMILMPRDTALIE